MSMSLVRPKASTAEGIALFQKGFRPFFFLAVLGAIAIVPTWLLMLTGHGNVEVDRHLVGAAWHAHELVFGYATAVIAGFLLTAVENWTERETAKGAWLAALCAVWLAGRIAVVAPIPFRVAEVIDLAFLPALIVTLARPLIRSGNRRNFVMLALLEALWFADLTSWSVEWRSTGLRVAIDIVVVLVAILCGRVVPMFTRSATHVESVRSSPALDSLAIASLVTVAFADATSASVRVRAIACAVAAFFVFARTAHWGLRHALRVPMLWILHAGHAFVGIGLVMRALPVVVPVISDSAATHAFTFGAIGCTTLGMMARVSLGHTGRLIEARAPIVIAFGLMVAGALVRIVGPHFLVAYASSLLFSGVAWTLAFVIFLVVYTPILFWPRVDGRIS